MSLRLRPFLFTLVLGLTVSAGQPAAAAAAAWDDPNQFAAEVVRLTNETRAAQGLAPLRRDARLDEAALLFSRYMGEAGFFDHIGPDGLNVSERLAKQGYGWTYWSENIAWGQRTPQEVLDAWLRSPGHRANLLSARSRDIGVGVAIVKGRRYITQDFGTLRATPKDEGGRGAPATRVLDEGKSGKGDEKESKDTAASTTAGPNPTSAASPNPDRTHPSSLIPHPSTKAPAAVKDPKPASSKPLSKVPARRPAAPVRKTPR